MIFHGEIPSGMCVCHKCDNPRCVNPEHLFLSDHKGNMMDRNKKGRAKGGALTGSKNPMAKFKEADIVEIRRMCSVGYKQKDVARIYNTKQGVISNIVSRKYWKHI